MVCTDSARHACCNLTLVSSDQLANKSNRYGNSLANVKTPLDFLWLPPHHPHPALVLQPTIAVSH